MSRQCELAGRGWPRRSSRQPLEHQDEAALSAEPLQRHAFQRCARPWRIHLKISANALRFGVEHRGGLDLLSFLESRRVKSFG